MSGGGGQQSFGDGLWSVGADGSRTRYYDPAQDFNEDRRLDQFDTWSGQQPDWMRMAAYGLGMMGQQGQQGYQSPDFHYPQAPAPPDLTPPPNPGVSPFMAYSHQVDQPMNVTGLLEILARMRRAK